MYSFKQFIITEASTPMDGIQLAKYLASKGYEIKTKTKTSMVVMVQGDRIKKMLDLASMLSNMGAKVDRNMKGSSIGGIVVGAVKILVKAAGRSGGLDVEAAAISDLEDAVMQAIMMTGGPISIRLKGRTVKNIVGVEKTDGTPKSDFHLIDANGKAVIHISHKKGSTAKDFQQWGGITEKEIANHPEVKYFEKQVNMLYPDGVMPNSQSAYMRIKDDALKMMAVYGVNYAKGGIDVNKVDVLIQGDPGLKYITNGVYSLTGTGHVHYLPELMTGEFEPVLAIIYKGDRTQLGLRGGRASIYPMGGRTFKTEIKNK
jgi:hypothetical protein